MISIGIDPGLNCGVAWLDCSTPARPVFMGCDVVDIGHRVKLAKPRDIGRGRVQEEERVVDDRDLVAMHDHFRNLFCGIALTNAVHHVIVTVERIERVTPRKRLGTSMAMATALHMAGDIGAEIRGLARTVFGIDRVRTATEDDWRTAVCGAVAGKKGDAKVGAVIPSAINGWPKRSQNHERDAAGVALFGARRAQLSAIGAVSL